MKHRVMLSFSITIIKLSQAVLNSFSELGETEAHPELQQTALIEMNFPSEPSGESSKVASKEWWLLVRCSFTSKQDLCCHRTFV